MFQLRLGDRDRCSTQAGAGNILGVRLQAEVQCGDIFLFRRFKIGHGPGGPADKDRQNAGGHRVQRATVSNAPFVEDAPQLRGDVLARPIGGLVNNDNSVGHSSPYWGSRDG